MSSILDYASDILQLKVARLSRYAVYMESMELQEFEILVSEAIDSLPEEMLNLLDNIIFLVADAPADGSSVLGTYEGFSLQDRSEYGYGEEPDRITVYKNPLLNICDTEDMLRNEIRITLVHEIAHFYGLSEERIHELGWG